MNGQYNGSYMRAFKILPLPEIKTACLSKKESEKLNWIDWYYFHGKKVRLTCRHFGLSFDVFYRWRKRFEEKGLTGLKDDFSSRKPHRLRTMTTPLNIINRIYSIRLNDLEKSKYEIKAQLKAEGISIGTSTIQKVINRHDELLNTQHLKRVRGHRLLKIKRLKAARELKEKALGSLVQMDTKYFYVLGKKYYLFSAIDCKSRYGFIHCYKTISSASGRDFIGKVKAYFPFPIKAINTDNGSEYLGQFHREASLLKIPHFFTDPNCPKQNSRVERFHQTAEYEYFNYQDDLLDDLSMINQHCQEFNLKYNYSRYHQAIGYQRPADYVRKLKEECYGM